MSVIFYVLGFLLFWFLCGIISCGLTFAYFQRKFAYIRAEQFERDKSISFESILLGPMGLLTDLSMGHYVYGWLWPWGKKAFEEMEASKLKLKTYI